MFFQYRTIILLAKVIEKFIKEKNRQKGAKNLLINRFLAPFDLYQIDLDYRTIFSLFLIQYKESSVRKYILEENK